MSKNAIKSMTLQGVLIAALGASGASGSITDDPKVAAAIDKIASAAGLLLATFGRLRKKDLHVKKAPEGAGGGNTAGGPTVPLLLFLVGTLGLTGCGTLRALAGPDPALVIAAPTIDAALDSDSAAHPENKADNDAAKEALSGAVSPRTPPVPPGPWSPWLEFGLGLLTYAGGHHVYKKHKAKKAAKAAATPGVASPS